MIDNNTVKYVASLSRLDIRPEETAGFIKNLEDILAYVDQLKALDVSGVKPTSHVLNVENVFREDEIRPSLTQTQALSFSIESHAGHYKVPKVIE